VAILRMKAYYLPFAAGLALAVSAFLPWVQQGPRGIGAVPAMSAIWILVLGALAMLLAVLSVLTRKNSRHPLLVVGLAALGIELLAWRWLRRSVAEEAWADAQARAIVEGAAPALPAAISAAPGLYVGLAASIVLVLFGLTIVVKRVASPYAAPEDDL
jgi:hypothetical protein